MAIIQSKSLQFHFYISPHVLPCRKVSPTTLLRGEDLVCYLEIAHLAEIWVAITTHGRSTRPSTHLSLTNVIPMHVDAGHGHVSSLLDAGHRRLLSTRRALS